MAQNYNNGNRGNYPNGGGNRNNTAQVNMDPMPLPANYVDAAEAIIAKLPGDMPITSTKIRKIFGLFTDVYNGVKRAADHSLNADQIQALSTARIRMVYECGRDDSTKNFVQQA